MSVLSRRQRTCPEPVLESTQSKGSGSTEPDPIHYPSSYIFPSPSTVRGTLQTLSAISRASNLHGVGSIIVSEKKEGIDPTPCCATTSALPLTHTPQRGTIP